MDTISIYDPFQEQLQQRMNLAKQQGWSDDEISQSAQYERLLHQQQLAQQQSMQQSLQNRQSGGKKESWWEKLLPSAGGIGGGAAGAAIGTAILPGVGTLLGGLLGGAIGGGTGKVAENATTGQNLGNGVAGQALENGVLSAGPLRLGKAVVDTVKGVRTGKDLLEAANAGAKSANSMSLLKSVGNKVSNKGTGLIAKEFRLTPTQQFNFKNLHGEDATDVLRRYGIKKPEQVAEKIQPLQESFNGVVDNIPAISTNDLSQGLKNVYEPLQKSPAIFEQSLGQQVKAQADELLKQAKNGSISASDVNKMRQTFDNAVNYTQRGAPEYNVLKKTADALRTTLQGAADKAGVKVGNQTFKQIGLELNKLHGINDIVGRQAYNGSGSLPVSLPNLLGTIGGSAAFGGPAGGAGGLLATTVLNSPGGRRLLANGVIKGGEKIANKGARNLAKPFGVKGVAERVAPVGLLEAMNQSPENNSANTTANPINTNAPMNAANIPGQYTTDTDNSNPQSLLSSSQGLSPQDLIGSGAQSQSYEGSTQYYLDGAQRAAAAGDFDSANSLMNMAKTVAALTTPTTPDSGHTKATAQQYAMAQSGLSGLSQLAQMLQQNPDILNKTTIPGQGAPILGGLISNALGTGQYNALANNILDALARVRTGAAVTSSEEAFYRNLLPKAGDNQGAVNQKLQQLYQAFQPFISGGSDSAQDLLTQLNAASAY